MHVRVGTEMKASCLRSHVVVLKWSLSTSIWMQAHEAWKCRFYRHVDAGTGGTEVQVLHAVREPWDMQVSREARGCKQRRRGNEANAGTDMLLLEARISTLWM